VSPTTFIGRDLRKSFGYAKIKSRDATDYTN
jgi:hypothetical protein